MNPISTAIKEKLERFGQSHLLQFQPHLPPEQWDCFVEQLEGVDWQQLSRLASADEAIVDWSQLARRAEPPPAFILGDSNPVIKQSVACEAGRQALRDGRVGVILVAGGQGTRLGFQPPKGLFPIGPLSGRSLFQMHCDRLLAVSRRYGHSIPIFIMTSPATDADTRRYFDAESQCGLANGQLSIFCQGTMPAIDSKTGQVLFASQDSIALSPDGHGGIVQALQRSGDLTRMADQGIDLLYYAQVDNPLASLCDPELIGYHLMSRSQITTQVVKKRFPKEKVGNVVSIDGKVQIIEYSDLPDEVAELKESDGSLKFWAGNIAIHVFDVGFLRSVTDNPIGLPFHQALKKVPYVDLRGKVIEPSQPNAIKFERFVFDLLPMADRAIVVEGDATEIFAPVKNADGEATDTPEHCKQALLAQHRRWIESAGSTVAEGVSVEINPLWALDASEVVERLSTPVHFAADTYLC